MNSRALRAATLPLIAKICGISASIATGTTSVAVSTGPFLNSAGLMVIAPLVATIRVCPSGSPFVTCSSAMLPPAPVRFSMMIGKPVFLPNQSPATRAKVSVAAPAATGTAMRIGFDDSDCADAVATQELRRATHPINFHNARLVRMFDTLLGRRRFRILEICRNGPQQFQEGGYFVLRQACPPERIGFRRTRNQ